MHPRGLESLQVWIGLGPSRGLLRAGLGGSCWFHILTWPLALVVPTRAQLTSTDMHIPARTWPGTTGVCSFSTVHVAQN